MINIDEDTKKAYKEVYRIIEHSEDDVKKVIPQKFIYTLQSAMDKDYEPTIDYSKDLEGQGLMPETFTLMAIIYRSFLNKEG